MLNKRFVRILIVLGSASIGLSSTAGENVTSAAEQGDPEAQFRLGRAYQFGEEGGGGIAGIPADHDQAMTWIRKAADRGLPQAQYWLSQYWRGEHGQYAKEVLPDQAKALAWLRRAAEQGHPHSQFRLGEAFYDGDQGVIRDYAKAVTWYRKAAEQGHSLAQTSLSTCYWFGEGVSRDAVQAYAWQNLARSGRWPMLDLLDLMEEKMSPAQIEEAQAASRALVERVPVLEDFQQYGGFETP